MKNFNKNDRQSFINLWEEESTVACKETLALLNGLARKRLPYDDLEVLVTKIDILKNIIIGKLRGKPFYLHVVREAPVYKAPTIFGNLPIAELTRRYRNVPESEWPVEVVRRLQLIEGNIA